VHLYGKGSTGHVFFSPCKLCLKLHTYINFVCVCRRLSWRWSNSPIRFTSSRSSKRRRRCTKCSVPQPCSLVSQSCVASRAPYDGVVVSGGQQRRIYMQTKYLLLALVWWAFPNCLYMRIQQQKVLALVGHVVFWISITTVKKKVHFAEL